MIEASVGPPVPQAAASTQQSRRRSYFVPILCIVSTSLALLFLSVIAIAFSDRGGGAQVSEVTPPKIQPTAHTTPPTVASDASKMWEKQTPKTGIRESVVVAALNDNMDLPQQFHHNFEFIRQTEPDASERVAFYKDLNTDLILIATGDSEDLLFVQLLMAVDSFLDERDGVATGEGGAAFGRCVQRLTAAVDPSWVGELYDWMTQSIPAALLTKGGVSKSKRHLMAKFDTDTLNDTMMVSFIIGLPEDGE